MAGEWGGGRGFREAGSGMAPHTQRPAYQDWTALLFRPMPLTNSLAGAQKKVARRHQRRL